MKDVEIFKHLAKGEIYLPYKKIFKGFLDELSKYNRKEFDNIILKNAIKEISFPTDIYLFLLIEFTTVSRLNYLKGLIDEEVLSIDFSIDDCDNIMVEMLWFLRGEVASFIHTLFWSELDSINRIIGTINSLLKTFPTDLSRVTDKIRFYGFDERGKLLPILVKNIAEISYELAINYPKKKKENELIMKKIMQNFDIITYLSKKEHELLNVLSSLNFQNENVNKKSDEE